MSKLPVEDRPLVMDPDLAAHLEHRLRPLTGKRLETAQEAVRRVRASGLTGTWDVITARYDQAIAEAVG